MYIDFLLIHVFSIEQDRFISGSLQLHSFMNWFLLPFYHLTLMSFCTKGLPGVAESTHIILCAGLEGLAKETTFAITLPSLFFMAFMNSVSMCFFFKNVWS